MEGIQGIKKRLGQLLECSKLGSLGTIAKRRLRLQKRVNSDFSRVLFLMNAKSGLQRVAMPIYKHGEANVACCASYKP